MAMLGKRVTLVMQEALPLERGFGPVAGRFVHDLLTAHGIDVVGATDVVEFAGEGEGDARVSAVVCADGRRVDADLVVVGVGAQPDVLLARKAGLELGESGGVLCDATLRSSVEGIFAAGDLCEYDSVVHGRRLRIEHEEVAAAQGRHAARAMLGSDEPYAEIPYFWSDLADWATLEYVGPAESWDEEIVRGDPAAGEFSIFYADGGRIVAALAVGRGDDLEAAKALIAEGAGVEAFTRSAEPGRPSLSAGSARGSSRTAAGGSPRPFGSTSSATSACRRCSGRSRRTSRPSRSACRRAPSRARRRRRTPTSCST